ncbi:hypothetical protein M6D93_03950 [Jatrophihabitans telluris]|uniref:Type III polyketide synthase n=1 Tax=Jatrophihabitans telluris TaxID=2038343 RepID=A0ABY4R0W4_9ACTN|nr:3-oxoacyl-[acyl-carrier-protein] synthase III C-terminal domain-containing protein [Jatrophihabitans telluris]UQX89162.1 hypothetical protein M6D93_03950 [Jatrophihabitans telluris]
MTVIAAVHPVLPEHRYPQRDITELFAQLIGDPARAAVMRRLHGAAGVRSRHLAVPLERYPELADFTESNDVFIASAVELGAEAVTGAVKQAGLSMHDVDLVVSTTVTGIAAPSLEARIANRVGLRPDVKRMPMFGLGCVAGAAGVARLHDYLRGDPDGVAVLLSVELCSLTVQRGDSSTANLVASGLFGDGAAAVLAVGDRRAESLAETGPRVVDSISHLYPDTERTMGWDVTSGGLKIVLSADVPSLAREHLGVDVDRFLARHGVTVDDISTWICHPGGPKVIEAIQDVLDVGPHELRHTWDSLAEVGNLSSASVLDVFARTLAQPDPPEGLGVLMAMGPGFCSELVLLDWR